MKGEVRRAVPEIGEAVIRFEVYSEDGRMICAIDQLDGHIKLRPKAWLSLVRGELTLLERIAKDAGCDEMRMAGRFNRRMFPDYEDYETFRGDRAIRKRL